MLWDALGCFGMLWWWQSPVRADCCVAVLWAALMFLLCFGDVWDTLGCSEAVGVLWGALGCFGMLWTLFEVFGGVWDTFCIHFKGFFCFGMLWGALGCFWGALGAGASSLFVQTAALRCFGLL